MKKINTELIVGLFVILGFLAFVYLSLQLGEFSIFAIRQDYVITAEFDNISGLKRGANIEIAGVSIGKVADIGLAEGDMAKVTMHIAEGVAITEDAIASIRTQGLIGDKYIRVIQGGSDVLLENNGTLIETESAIDIEELVSKYIFEGGI